MTAEPKQKLSPGFRFYPTDEELITFYLMNKINDATFTARAIADVDLNKYEPWELPAKAKMGEKEWYFFSLRDRKYPTGVRTNRATNIGYWKTTGKDREIFNSATSELAGMKKTLVFYTGRAPRGEKSNWVMHEYRIHSKSDFKTSKQHEWVICRVFQKSKDINEYPKNQSRAANPYNLEIGPIILPPIQLGDPNHHQFPFGRNDMTSTALETSFSSSPCSSSSSSSPYDVFLSFNGEDTRKTFTDHLYWTMKDAGIDFFMEENESIRRGENISDKVKQIIEGSRVSVIVFSCRYADSIWCLEELVHIMECRRTLKQIVLPIFYDLSPSDAMGTFALAFQKHRERFNKDTDKEEKIQRWTDALIEGADLTTWVFRTTNGYEGMFIREIIEEITRQFKSPIPIGTAFSELQGIDSPLQSEQSELDSIDIENLFQTCDSGFVSDSGKYHGSKISQDLLPPPPQTSSMHNNAEILPVSSIQGQWKKGKLIRFCTLGDVYLATNQETGALCEMKEVDHYSADCIKYLEQEIKILRTLTHPNIVHYYGSEVIDNHLCSYLEYVPVSIDEYVQDLVGAMTESVVRNFSRHILSGLAFLHGRKMIHRDIRGANLRVDASGVVKLANFGLANHLNGQSNILSFKHSPNWMAPELIWTSRQNNADPDFDLAVDIWSLGCTIIEMFTGKPPWSELTPLEVMQKLLNSIPDIPETLSAEGKDFLELCFRRNPAERPSAVQLLDRSFVHLQNP